MSFFYSNSPVGILKTSIENSKVAAIDFVESMPDHSCQIDTYDQEIFELINTELINYFEGNLREFTLPLKYGALRFSKRYGVN